MQGVITVANPGIYEVVAGFFSKQKPTFQVLVNGTIALRAGSHVTCVGQHTIPHTSRADGLTGTHVTGYLLLPSNSCVTVVYQSHIEAGQGFVSLQHIC